MNRKTPYSVSGFISYTLCLLCFLIMYSCTSTRKTYKAPIKEYGSDYLFNQLSKNELKFDWFSAKFHINYKCNKKNTEFKGQIRIRKDSVIWISFSPALGIEMARLIITNDSVKFLNRINKIYFLGDYDFVNEFLKTNIDFDILQSFIIGNDFQFYEKIKFKASIDSWEYRLSTLGRNKLKKYVKKSEENPKVFIQTIWLDPGNFKISRISIKEIKKENKKLNAYYTDLKVVKNQLFPYKIKFILLNEDNIKVDVHYSKISIDKPQNVPFNIPSRYTRVY